MGKKFSFFYAFRTIFSRNSSRVFRHIRGAVIGAAISLIPLVVVLEIADGMIKGIVDRYVEISSFHLQVRLPVLTDKESPEEFVEKIRSMENVRMAFPYTEGNGILYSSGGRTGITVRGIPDNVYSQDEGFSRYISVSEGEFSLSEKDSIIISRETAALLKVGCGDTVKLLTAKQVPGRQMLLRPTKFTVRGIYTSGYQELDMLSAFITSEYGEKLFADPDRRMIAVKTDNAYSSSLYTVASDIRHLSIGTRAYTWEALNDTLVTTMGTTRKFLIFIMILILGVASINISSSMIMIVISKKQDIAVLKSMGASDSDISAIFILQGFFIGAAAAFIGLALGIFAALNINEIIDMLESVLNMLLQRDFRLSETGYYLERIPVELSLPKLAGCGALAILFSVVASWLPARHAGRIRPVEIFRKH
ncbi:MAG: ABC transporter permease [Spirochaetia bacterium]|nr:ABC transporter permease [Spirochaetia bacterium]